MSGLRDAELDALALIQARLDGDVEAWDVILSACDQRDTCSVLSRLAAWLVSRFGPENQAVLMGGLRKAALGQPVRLVSDGERVTEVLR